MNNNAGASTNNAVAGHRGPTYPLAATHVDFGCLACGKIIKTCRQSTALRNLIGQHKKTSPDCFTESSIDSDADCARALEQDQRSNLALFERNRYGDTDGFFDTTGDIAIVQCSNCSRCFEKKTEGDGHVRAGRNKCSGATLRPITGRIMSRSGGSGVVFGILLSVPAFVVRHDQAHYHHHPGGAHAPRRRWGGSVLFILMDIK